ncbi:MAG: hypothetical protein KA096_00855 [Bacteroidales bacterium]|nr:hypothetical protein [Bacteroidales bacterium]
MESLRFRMVFMVRSRGRTIRNYFIILLYFLAIPLQGQNLTDLLPNPAELPGWTLQSQTVMNGDELYMLINGGADIYHEYGFSRVVSALYSDPGQNVIRAEIYEMTDDGAAYGVYSINHLKASWTGEFGKQSTVTDDFIAFWKSRYYVILSWKSKKNGGKPLLGQLAALIDGKISTSGDIPGILGLCSAQASSSNKAYLRGNIGLSNFYYIDYRNPFDFKAAMVFSREDYHVILLEYTNSTESFENMQSARQSLSENKRFTDLTNTYQGFSIKDNKGNRIVVRQENRYLILLVGLSPDAPLSAKMEEISLEIDNLNH